MAMTEEQRIEALKVAKQSFEDKKAACDHFGHFHPVVSSILGMQTGVMIFTFVSCSQCGFVSANVESIPANQLGSSIAVPQINIRKS